MVAVRLSKFGLPLMVCVVCLLLLTAQTRGLGAGLAADAVAFVVTPVQSLLVKIHRGTLGLWATYVDWKAVRSENVALRLEAERLRLQALQAEEARQENIRLRRMLELRVRLPLSALAGEVIGREEDGWVRAITVNRGHASGVTRQIPVIVPEGLVGRVLQVRGGASVIQLLNDPTSTVGGVVQRTRTHGLVEGHTGGTVRLKFMARGAQVEMGDLVVTSGVGNLFPKGLPIGRVIAIQDKGSALFHFAVLAPAVDFARVEEVLLLTGQTPQDLARLFHPDG
jgi:rod shape-determining protein MreC